MTGFDDPLAFSSGSSLPSSGPDEDHVEEDGTFGWLMHKISKVEELSARTIGKLFSSDGKSR